MSESNGKIHSGNKRRKKAVKVKEEITVAQQPSGYFFSDTELTIVSLLFLWAVLASVYVAVDLFFYDL